MQGGRGYEVMLKLPNPSAFVVEKLVVDLSCTLLYEILGRRPTTFSYDRELCRPFVFAQSFTITTTSKIHPDFGNDHFLNPKASLSLSLSIYIYIYIYTITLVFCWSPQLDLYFAPLY
jgi:hypothetical protein